MLYQLKDKISIVIPCYREDDDIEELLDSIASQYYINNVDVLVVNRTKCDKITEKVLEKQKEHTNINISIYDEINDDIVNFITNKNFILYIDPNIILDSHWTLFNYVSRQSKKEKVCYSFDNKKDESYFSKLLHFFEGEPEHPTLQ